MHSSGISFVYVLIYIYKMDIFCICRICLNEPNTNFVSIYSHITTNQCDFNNSIITANNNQTQISSILDTLTGNKYNSNEFPYPDKICDLCLNDLKAAFEFRQRCENAFEQLIKLNEVNNGLSEQNFEFPAPLDNDKPIFIDTVLNNTIEIIENRPLENILISKNEQKEKVDEIKLYDVIEEKTVETKDEAAENKSKNHQCNHCDKIFSRQTHLRRHMTIHTDERAFACKSCDKKFRRADHLKIHENFHAKIKPHMCQHCQKPFSRAEHLKRHILSRHTKKTTTFPCSKCEYVAENAKDLNVHRRTHNENWLTCKSCDGKFTSKSELTEHIKTHSNDERPFLCSECGMRFIRNDYLVIHMRRHTGEKPYKCRFCDRAFPRATDLTVHERYHTNEKKHTCNLCGKGFARAYNLTVHMRVHTGERPYQCPHCSKGFSQGNDLKAHIRRHTGERYQCEYCEASFIQIYLLNNHKKNNHGVQAKSNISRVTKFESASHNTPPSSHIETFQHEPETGCIEYTIDEC